MSNFHPLFPMSYPAAVSPLPLEKRMPKAAAFIVQGPRIVEGRVEYRTWAPIAEAVDAVIYDEDGRELRTVSLARAGEGRFSGTDPLGKAGDLYMYRLDG